MLNQCTYNGTTPLYLCDGCNLLLETFCFIMSEDGYPLAGECDQYLCPIGQPC